MEPAEKLQSLCASAINGYDVAEGLMSLYREYVPRGREPDDDFKAALGTTFTRVLLGQLACPGALTRSRLLCLELAVRAVDVAAPLLLGDERSMMNLTDKSTAIVSEELNEYRFRVLVLLLERAPAPLRCQLVAATIPLVAAFSSIPPAALSFFSKLRSAFDGGGDDNLVNAVSASLPSMVNSLVARMQTAEARHAFGLVHDLLRGPTGVHKMLLNCEVEMLEKMLGATPSAEAAEVLVLLGRAGAPHHLALRLRVADELRSKAPAVTFPTLAPLLVSYYSAEHLQSIKATTSALMPKFQELLKDVSTLVNPEPTGRAIATLIKEVVFARAMDEETWRGRCSCLLSVITLVGLDRLQPSDDTFYDLCRNFVNSPLAWCMPNLMGMMEPAARLNLCLSLLKVSTTGCVASLCEFQNLAPAVVDALLAPPDATQTRACEVLGAAIDQRLTSEVGHGTASLKAVRHVAPESLEEPMHAIDPGAISPEELFPMTRDALFGPRLVAVQASDGQFDVSITQLLTARAAARSPFFSSWAESMRSAASPELTIDAGAYSSAAVQAAMLHVATGALPPTAELDPGVGAELMAVGQAWAVPGILALARRSLLRRSLFAGEGNTNSIQKARYLADTLLPSADADASSDTALAVASVLLARLSVDGVELEDAQCVQLRPHIIKAVEALLIFS